MKRKAQAALEFLMTYGWAFLVILVMIGALAYFGVLSPTKLLPERCTVAAGFQCDEYAVTTSGDDGTVTLVLVNQLGESIFFNETGNITFVEGGLANAIAPDIKSPADPTDVISPGEKATYEFVIPDLANYKGDKVRLPFTVNYIPVGKTITKTVSGEVFALIE